MPHKCINTAVGYLQRTAPRQPAGQVS